MHNKAYLLFECVRLGYAALNQSSVGKYSIKSLQTSSESILIQKTRIFLSGFVGEHTIEIILNI